MPFTHSILPTGVSPGPSSDSNKSYRLVTRDEPGNNFTRPAPVTTSESRPEITFLSRCFTVAHRENGERLVLWRGKRHCWHEVRDARLAAVVLAGLETAVVS